MEPLFEKLLGQEQAAELLGIHPEMLRRMAVRGEIPALKVGRYWKYRASALEAWVSLWRVRDFENYLIFYRP